MFQALFENITEKDKNIAINNIIDRATPRQDFFVMITLAVSMAAFGVLLDSVVILIGSMLIAPLLYPLLSLGLGVITNDLKLIGRSFYTVLKSAGMAIVASFVIGFLFKGASHGSFLTDVVVGGSSSFMYTVIAAIAGFAAALAITKPHLNETLPGVAISVALVPPLAVTGIGFAFFDWAVVSNGLLLFIVNVIGILFSSMIVFSLFQFASKKKVAEKAVEKEDKEIKKEKDIVAKAHAEK